MSEKQKDYYLPDVSGPEFAIDRSHPKKQHLVIDRTTDEDRYIHQNPEIKKHSDEKNVDQTDETNSEEGNNFEDEVVETIAESLIDKAWDLPAKVDLDPTITWIIIGAILIGTIGMKFIRSFFKVGFLVIIAVAVFYFLSNYFGGSTP